MLETHAYILAGAAFVAKLYARYWSYRPMPTRPIGTRTNDVLNLIDLATLTIICGAFFFMLRPGRLGFACGLAAALLLLDVGLRYLFIELEARRLCGRSRKWTKRNARKHVRRCAASAMYN